MNPLITSRDRRNAFRLGLTAGTVSVQMSAWRLGSWLRAGLHTTRGKLLGMMALLTFMFMTTAPAWAGQGGCASKSAATLLKFVNFLAEFLIGVGAATAGLMLAVGALFIIFGGTPQRVNKGMEILKQTIIALAILASGVFIQQVVMGFVFTGKDQVTSC